MHLNLTESWKVEDERIRKFDVAKAIRQPVSQLDRDQEVLLVWNEVLAEVADATAATGDLQ